MRWKCSVLLLLLCSAIHINAQQETLNVVSWDGAYVKSQILGFIRPWEEQTGHRVKVIHYAGGIDEIRRQVRAWNVSWDVVDLELFDAIRACEEGLLERIEFSKLPPSPQGTPADKDFINLDATPCGVGHMAGATVVSYSGNRFRQAPQTLEDFFDVNRYPGKRGLRKSPQGNLEWALIVDGVKPDEVYSVLSTPAGLARSFASLNRLKPHVIWWETGQEAIQLLTTNRVAMSSVYSGRVAAAQQRGDQLDIIWDHQVWYYDVWGIPKHGRNTKLAQEFVRHATSTQSLAAQVKYIPYGPMRRSSIALLSEQQRAQLPTSQAHMRSAVRLNAQWWSQNIDQIKPRFERWLQRPVMVPKALPR